MEQNKQSAERQEETSPDSLKKASAKGENMKARTITAVGYVAVILGLVALKWAFPVFGSIGFDVLFWTISVIGAYEFMRAVGGISKAQWWTVIITCVLLIPAFVIVKMVVGSVMGNGGKASEAALVSLMAVASVGAMVTASMLVFDFNKSSLHSTAYSLFCIIYCGVLGCVGSNVNHMATNSLPAVFMLFAITAGVDTFALLIGMALGKVFPLKLAPRTSPNKTVIGAVGGLIGGVFAALVVYFMCEYVPGFGLDYSGDAPKWLLLILISLPTSIFAQLGDLFESAIKRGCGVKDMGKLLPGHGGMLDRFDSMLFAAVSLVVCFIAVR